MPRTIEEFISELPLDQQDKIEKRYQALRQTVLPPRRDKAPDGSPTVPSTGQRHS